LTVPSLPYFCLQRSPKVSENLGKNKKLLKQTSFCTSCKILLYFLLSSGTNCNTPYLSPLLSSVSPFQLPTTDLPFLPPSYSIPQTMTHYLSEITKNPPFPLSPPYSASLSPPPSPYLPPHLPPQTPPLPPHLLSMIRILLFIFIFILSYFSVY